MITRDLLIKALENMAQIIHENKEFLTDLDMAIGDSDHGINMDKGFNTVKDKLPSVAQQDCGTILKTVAMTLISTVGGASGPLYGTAFLKAAMLANQKMEISNEDLVNMFGAAIQGIQERGKAEPGDKTMIDALIPAYEALKQSFNEGRDLTEALAAALDAAQKGVEYTKTISAKRGRASYLGERSIGHQDPGATSSYLLLKALNETVKGGK